MKQRKFIITADDYGMCTPVNQAIDDCIAAGLITTTNVIVNMEDLTPASTLRQRFPQISVGMHWNITAGKPISHPKDIPTLVTEQGLFFKLKDFLNRFHKGLISSEDIRTELLAQYNVFRELVGKADYWNTHQNSGLDFKTFPIFNKVALELGIDKTRSFQRVYVKERRLPGGLKGRLVELAKKIVFDVWFGKIIPKSGTKLPDARMIYFDDYQKTDDIKNIADNVCWNGKEIVEMVVHPATVANYHSFGGLTDIRLREWKMFSDPETLKYLNNHGIEMVNFDAIDNRK